MDLEPICGTAICWRSVTAVENEPTKNYVFEFPHIKDAFMYQQLILTHNPAMFPEYKIARKFFGKFLIYKQEYHTLTTFTTIARACIELHNNHK